MKTIIKAIIVLIVLLILQRFYGIGVVIVLTLFWLTIISYHR